MRLRRFFSDFGRRALRDLVSALTLRELLPLALAIFALFAVLGTMTDVMGGGRMPAPQVVATCAFSGTIALFYAFGSLRRQWVWVAVALALQLAWPSVSRPFFSSMPAPAAPCPAGSRRSVIKPCFSRFWTSQTLKG